MQNEYNNEPLTSHAKWRQLKRGIRDNILHIFQNYADSELYAKGSAFKIFISDYSAKLAIKNGINASEIEQAKRICAICADGKIITIYRRKSKKPNSRSFAPTIKEIWA